MTSTNYISYFRQMAAAHSKLQHRPATESEDAPVGQQHFARFSADEVVTGLRTKLSFPALLVEMYEIKTHGTSKLQIRGDYQGAFSVFASAGLEDYNEQAAAYDLTEEILWDILAQMYQDHYGPGANSCGSPLKDVDFNNLNIIPVGPVFDSEFGWRCEFSFNLNNLTRITTKPADGVFIPFLRKEEGNIAITTENQSLIFTT